jgi:phthalate 4,5-dioxygenase oxygenase subunit
VNHAFNDTAPKFDIEETTFGYHYAALRDAGGGRVNVRVVPQFLPYGRVIPLPGFESTILEVPIDDDNTSTYLVDQSQQGPLSVEARLKRSGMGAQNYRDHTFLVDKANHFGQDRKAMREKRSWSGLDGLTQEDATVTVSMGRIYDRSTEHLVASDAAIVRLRQQLMRAVETCMAGGDPPDVLTEDMTGVRGVDVDIESGKPWRELVPGHVPANATLR